MGRRKKLNLYPWQKKITKETISKFKEIKKILWAINCRLGKTIMACDMACDLGKLDYRILISAFNKNEIKMGWVDKIFKNNLIPPELLQVVVSKSDLKKVQKDYPGVNFVTRKNIDKTKPITIILPQSVEPGDVGKVDFIIIDEAHEYLEVRVLTDAQKIEDGKLKKIIKRASRKNTCMLGLSGTAHELTQKGIFSKNTHLIVRDAVFAIKQEMVLPFAVSLEYFDYNIKESEYNKKGNLKRDALKSLNSKILHKDRLKEVLKKIPKKYKTLVIVPHGKRMVKPMASFIESIYGPNTVVTKTYHDTTDMKKKTEKLFEKHPNCKFLVVEMMCGTGWDFPRLDCVVDLSLTRNVKLIMQRIFRPCTPDVLSNGKSRKKKPMYFYACSNNKDPYFFQRLILEGYNYMTEEGIRNPELAKKSNLYKKSLERVVGSNSVEIPADTFMGYYEKGIPRVRNNRACITPFRGVFIPWHLLMHQILKNKGIFQLTETDEIKEMLNSARARIHKTSKHATEYGMTAIAGSILEEELEKAGF